MLISTLVEVLSQLRRFSKWPCSNYAGITVSQVWPCFRGCKSTSDYLIADFMIHSLPVHKRTNPLRASGISEWTNSALIPSSPEAVNIIRAKIVYLVHAPLKILVHVYLKSTHTSLAKINRSKMCVCVSLTQTEKKRIYFSFNWKTSGPRAVF